MYFSKRCSVKHDVAILLIYDLLTRPASLYLLRRDRQNRQDLNHNLCNDTHHFRRRRHVGVAFEGIEMGFDTLENIDECVLGCLDILGCLDTVSVKLVRTKVL